LNSHTEGQNVTREVTNKLLELAEEGVYNKDTILLACLQYMSEDDVADMARANEFWLALKGYDADGTETDDDDDDDDDA
jgi:hypothetical protein